MGARSYLQTPIKIANTIGWEKFADLLDEQRSIMRSRRLRNPAAAFHKRLAERSGEERERVRFIWELAQKELARPLATGCFGSVGD